MDPKNVAGETDAENLEVRFAQQEQSLNELSDEVYEQQKQIARLEGEVRFLAERLQRVERQDSPATEPAAEVPPHY